MVSTAVLDEKCLLTSGELLVERLGGRQWTTGLTGRCWFGGFWGGRCCPESLHSLLSLPLQLEGRVAEHVLQTIIVPVIISGSTEEPGRSPIITLTL